MHLPFARKRGAAGSGEAGERTLPIELAPGNRAAFSNWLTAYRERLKQLTEHEDYTRDQGKEE